MMIWCMNIKRRTTCMQPKDRIRVRKLATATTAVGEGSNFSVAARKADIKGTQSKEKKKMKSLTNSLKSIKRKTNVAQ